MTYELLSGRKTNAILTDPGSRTARSGDVNIYAVTMLAWVYSSRVGMGSKDGRRRSDVQVGRAFSGESFSDAVLARQAIFARRV